MTCDRASLITALKRIQESAMGNVVTLLPKRLAEMANTSYQCIARLLVRLPFAQRRPGSRYVRYVFTKENLAKAIEMLELVDTGESSKTIAIHVPRALIEMIDDLAKERRMQRAELIRRILAEQIINGLSSLPPEPPGKMSVISIRVGRKMLAALDELAARHGLSRSALVRRMIWRFFANDEEEDIPVIQGRI